MVGSAQAVSRGRLVLPLLAAALLAGGGTNQSTGALASAPTPRRGPCAACAYRPAGGGGEHRGHRRGAHDRHPHGHGDQAPRGALGAATFAQGFTARSADGRTATARIRTPGCGRRLGLVAPRRAKAGIAVPLTLVDRWRLGGFRARLCVVPPRPRALSLRADQGGTRAAVTSFRALRPGPGLLRLATSRGPRARGGARPAARREAASARHRRLDDQITDGYLQQRLAPRGVRVRSDAYISTGISKPSPLDWQRGQRQAARRPDVVVMFLGANDGFPWARPHAAGRLG